MNGGLFSGVLFVAYIVIVVALLYSYNAAKRYVKSGRRAAVRPDCPPRGGRTYWHV